MPRISPGDLIKHRYHERIGLAVAVVPIDHIEGEIPQENGICNVLVHWLGDGPLWVPMGEVEKISK